MCALNKCWEEESWNELGLMDFPLPPFTAPVANHSLTECGHSVKGVSKENIIPRCLNKNMLTLKPSIFPGLSSAPTTLAWLFYHWEARVVHGERIMLSFTCIPPIIYFYGRKLISITDPKAWAGFSE